MNQRNAYLIQILEKIGTPIVSSVLKDTQEDTKDEAEKVAALLAKTVQLSIELGNMVEIDKSSPNEIESLRVTMAGLAGPMIANHYAQQSKVPGDQDLKKIIGTLEAVMSFSDNFTPASEHVVRLENMKANGLPVDSFQTNIQFVQAFSSVTDAIASFPFGQSERKMIMDVADRITTKARQIRGDVFAETLDEQQKMLCELALVRSLADIYTQCHKNEMNRLMSDQEASGAAQQDALQTLWQAFDTRAEILGALAVHLVPAGKVSSQNAPDKNVTAAPPAQSAPQVTSSAQTPPPQQASETTQQATPLGMFAQPQNSPGSDAQQPAASLQQQQNPSQTATAPSGNPLSMFAKPKDQAEQPISQAAPPPPMQEGQMIPPQETQPAPQETQQPPQQQGGGNPMSFFKTPPKGEEE